jgi:hypothetical protein
MPIACKNTSPTRTGPPSALSSTRERNNRGFIHPSLGSSVVVVWKGFAFAKVYGMSRNEAVDRSL